jgi:EAL domain-containing protein (putative c-di-GMP-specific phosphodiesterase class I)/FixJ family two-component response regulator
MQTRAVEDDQPHLLVVDDDPDMGEFIADVAERVGYRCTLAADTVQFTRAMGPDITLIMLDLMLPEIDGVELLRVLVQHGYDGRLVLMSGMDKRVLESAEDLAKALGLRVLRHFQKPIRLVDLEAFLQQHMSSHAERGTSKRDSQTVSAEELQHAIAEDQFLLHYQPQLAIASGHVVGVEALVRWQHPERGLIYPDAFIGLAESLGLIDALGWLVMQRGLREFGTFAAHGAPCTLSLNVSAHSLGDLVLPDKLLALTRAYGVSPSRIVLEITESGLVRELAKALDILTRLRMKQFQLSIDDFGTGYAMMQQLRRVPATELKIDRPFVQDALTDDRASVIVQKTIELGHGLGMRVVAEGVETPRHLDLLKAHACDVAQGYLFSRPLALPDLLAWLGQQVHHGTTSTGA